MPTWSYNSRVRNDLWGWTHDSHNNNKKCFKMYIPLVHEIFAPSDFYKCLSLGLNCRSVQKWMVNTVCCAPNRPPPQSVAKWSRSMIHSKIINSPLVIFWRGHVVPRAPDPLWRHAVHGVTWSLLKACKQDEGGTYCQQINRTEQEIEWEIVYEIIEKYCNNVCIL